MKDSKTGDDSSKTSNSTTASRPGWVRTKAFLYQISGAKFLSQRRRALLADEMGLGKSAQAILACDMVGAKSVRVICPAIACENWRREFRKFSPSSFELSVHSYEKALRDGATYGKVDVLIIDEGHFLKNHEAKRTRAVLGKGGIAWKASRIWILTGTPMPNHPGELWVMLVAFGQTTLKYIPFITRFCDFAPGGGPTSGMMRIVGAKRSAVPELQNLIKPIMLRRTKEEVMPELPPLFFNDVIVKPGKVDFELCASFLRYVYPVNCTDELFVKLEAQEKVLTHSLELTSAGFAKGGGNHVTPETFKVLEALAKSVSTLRRYIGLQKVEPVLQMVTEELENNEYKKIVIFGIHQDVIHLLTKYLRKFRALSLYGGTAPELRMKYIDKFQTDPRYRVMICNIRAAGTAVTLTAADQCLFIEQEWTPADNAQAVMRLHRIGQTRPVNVRVVGIANSIDEKITWILRRKMRDLALVFTGGAHIPRGKNPIDSF